jgi:phage repressor protein C with HTH and peptisase S24 domain
MGVVMITHQQIWTALDGIAGKYGLSPSGLARKAGLDPTSFNRSKRISVDGRERWPSTESLAKVLDATGATLEDFLGFMQPEGRLTLKPASIPMVSLSQALHGGFFDEAGRPTGTGWDAVAFPDFDTNDIFAFEVSGNLMEPVYRDGDILIVSPGTSLRRGDRVVIKTRQGDIIARELRRKSPRNVELRTLTPNSEEEQIDPVKIEWMARVMWVSQ